jgi:hypothetical protein
MSCLSNHYNCWVVKHLVRLFPLLLALVISSGAMGGQPPIFSGNTVVNVSPGTGTLDTALSSHGANTTYLLSSGTYTMTNYHVIPSGTQILGAGMGSTIITRNGDFDQFDSQSKSNVQYSGFDCDMANGNHSAFDCSAGTNVLLQQVHVKNYSSHVLHSECFPVFFAAPLGRGNTSVVVDSCRFTQSSSGNVDGTTVVTVTGNTGQDQGCNVTNCTFDEPKDPGTLYYHCMEVPNLASGNTFIADSKSKGFTQFVYLENGSQGSSAFTSSAQLTCTIQNNTLTLPTNGDVMGTLPHNNGQDGAYIVKNNTIHKVSGATNVNVFHLINAGLGGPQHPPFVQSVTISGNTLDSGITRIKNEFGGTTCIGSLVTQ